MSNTNSCLTALDRTAPFTVQLFASAFPSGDALIWIAGAAMLVQMIIVIFHSVRSAKFVEGGGRAAVSVLISLLSVIGLLQASGTRSGHSTVRDPQSKLTTTVNFILTPYAALALTIVAVLLMVMFMCVVRVGRRGCARLHIWHQRFGQIRAKRQRNIRGGGASDGGRLSHGDRSGQSTGFADNDD